MKNGFACRIRPHVNVELAESRRAAATGDTRAAFRHLERAHVLGQTSTVEHVRVHVHMLWWAVRGRHAVQALGQLLRIVGAATKTAAGLVPEGNTGGADISPFRRLPIPRDLARLIEDARARR